jgi:acetoin utilization deacetylase AcuC-like enzyme
MLPFKVVYHPRYDLDLGPHVFPSEKFKMVHDALLLEGLADESDFLEPGPAADDDVLRVHTPAYVRKLQTDSLTLSERMKLEIPVSESTVQAFWLAAGGSILAGRSALHDGFAANLSGGFHHAYPGHGEGFCMLHDVAIAIRTLQAEGAIRTAMTVDTDVHHGNGTAAIFANDGSVHTLSIHQENNYPMPKPPSDQDIGLEDGTGDAEYLGALEKGLIHSLKTMTPDLIFYLGGADPYREDQLGGLALTMEG